MKGILFAFCAVVLVYVQSDFAWHPPTVNTSKHLTLLLQSSITYSIRLGFKEIWSTTCFTWGSPSPLSIKQISKLPKPTAPRLPAKRPPFLWCWVFLHKTLKQQGSTQKLAKKKRSVYGLLLLLIHQGIRNAFYILWMILGKDWEGSNHSPLGIKTVSFDYWFTVSLLYT